MSERILTAKNRVVRHGLLELVEHWAIALSGLALLVSGLFQLPIATRYKINLLPGMAWSADYFASLAVHYAASVIFVGCSLFHLVHHGLAGDRGLIPRKGDIKASIAVIGTFFGKGEEPPFAKYLPEQRLAYLGMAGIIAVLILSGLVKTFKNLYAPDLWYPLVAAATWLHNLFFVLFILAFIGHIGAILLKPNRPLARGIFTGAVRLDYARQRHPLWIDEIAAAAGGSLPPAAVSRPAETSAAGSGEAAGPWAPGAGEAAGTAEPAADSPPPDQSGTSPEAPERRET